MANYPSFPQLNDGSQPDIIDDRKFERNTAGGARGRSFFTGIKRRFTVTHDLDDADLATLEAFYITNRDLTVTFKWCRSATPYTVVFERAPSYSLALPNTRVTVFLGEV